MTPPRSVAIGRHAIRVDDDQPTFWDRVETGRWEPGTLAVLDRLVGPNATFLDLGAWVGPLSLYAAALGAKVIAVEADPVALEQLDRNLAANPALAPRITVVPGAAAASPRRVRLGARRKPGDSMSSVLLAASQTTWTAEAVVPDDLAALVGRAAELFVKIDIEGGEYALLPALAALLDRPGTTALVSFHPDILRASGGKDVRAVEALAAAPFAGWRAAPVSDAGLPDAGMPDQDLASFDPGAGAPLSGEWLFIHPRKADATLSR